MREAKIVVIAGLREAHGVSNYVVFYFLPKLCYMAWVSQRPRFDLHADQAAWHAGAWIALSEFPGG